MANRFIEYRTSPALLQWAAQNLGLIGFSPEARTISHMLQNDDGSVQPLAVVVFDRWTEFTCEVSIASDETGRWTSKGFIRTVYDYVFIHAKKLRMNMAVSLQNEKPINMHTALGHVVDGQLRDGFGEGHDGILYGFTKQDYLASKWHKNLINERKDNEQRKYSTTTRL